MSNEPDRSLVPDVEQLLGPELVENARTVEEVDAQLDTVDSQNRELYERIIGLYAAVIEAAVEGLKTAPKPDKGRYVSLKRALDERKTRFIGRFPEFVAEEQAAKEREKVEKNATELFAQLDTKEQIPEDEKNEFKRCWRQLPDNLKAGYLTQLKGAISRNTDQAAVLTNFRGTLFELSRQVILQSQGLEQLEVYRGEPIVVQYLGYPKDNPQLDKPPYHPLGGDTKSGDIQIDASGIVREGKPYVYETKAYPRRQYGADYGGGESIKARNQLLKYQKAVEEGKVSGATVEIQGRLDYQFLVWAIGEDISSEGAIPDVEVIYNTLLPSGSEYRFVLKKGRGEGLKFENDDEGYTEEDKLVIRGLAQAVRDKSITSIIQDVNIKPEDDKDGIVTQEHIDHPENITDPAVFNAYNELRHKNIWAKLSDKALNPKRVDKIAAYDQRATREHIMKELVDFQNLLRENPQMRALKWAYVLEEAQYDDVVNHVMDEVRKIREYESQRIGSSEEQERHGKRLGMGYVGPEEGYALDVEHILMDVIQNYTKTGEDQRSRSYDDVDRFLDLKTVREHLQDKDRSFTKITVYDPVTDKHIDTTITGDKAHRKNDLIAEHEKTLTLNNLKRAEQRLAKALKDYHTLHSVGVKNMDEEQKAEYGKLQSRLSGYNQGLRNRLERVQAELEAIETERDATLAPYKEAMQSVRGAAAITIGDTELSRTAVVDRLRSVSADYAQPILDKKAQILDVYKEIFAKDWNTFALREVEREEANVIKFIYAIPAEGPIMVEEERFRGGADSSRAAHSELARGRNIYAAGEIVFKKIGDEWVLTEINNGSGHYRPSQDVLNYAKKAIAEELGIDPNDDRIALRNCIFRGIDIDGLPLEEAA